MIFTGICLTVTTMKIPIRKTSISNVYDTDTGLVMRLFFLSEKRPFKQMKHSCKVASSGQYYMKQPFCKKRGLGCQSEIKKNHSKKRAAI